MHAPASRSLSSLAAVAVTTLAAACSSADPEPAAPPEPGPRLALVDSVVLGDTGALTLGDLRNAGLHLDDGAIWVGDPQNGRIVRFARDGAPLSQVGRKGGGPGELRAPGPLVPTSDGSVAVWDYTAGKLAAFDTASGAPRWETKVREQAFPMQLQAVGDTIWMGVVSLQGNTGAMRVAVRDGAVSKLAPAPAEYAEGLAHSFPYSVALRFADTLLVGYSGHHRIFLHHDDRRVDSLVVPHRLRRGVPPDLLARAKAGEYRGEGLGMENFVSSLSRAERLADGFVALVHYDVHFDQRKPEGAEVDAWLTVLDPTFERACTDARLPLVERALPSLAFRGDTLFALEHVIGDERAVPVLRAYVISTDRCDWLPVERG
ncbi:MAG TPA: hypothetical protein VGE02_05310 [Gemmatimonadales bacterium]